MDNKVRIKILQKKLEEATGKKVSYYDDIKKNQKINDLLSPIVEQLQKLQELVNPLLEPELYDENSKNVDEALKLLEEYQSTIYSQSESSYRNYQNPKKTNNVRRK